MTPARAQVRRPLCSLTEIIEKLAQAERIAKCGRPVRDFEKSLATALRFLGDPPRLWASDHFEDKRAVLKLVFTKPLSYVRGKGFLEPELAFRLMALGELVPVSTEWRRGWDSNPRRSLPLGAFQERCLKPLGHLSEGVAFW